jgi:hypothetical protein
VVVVDLGGVLLVLWQLGHDVRCEQDGLQEKLKVFGEFHVRVQQHNLLELIVHCFLISLLLFIRIKTIHQQFNRCTTSGMVLKIFYHF